MAAAEFTNKTTEVGTEKHLEVRLRRM